MKKSYFAAANTERGFVSIFDKVFDVSRLSHFYIIKGGPGTGKSTFMKEIAEDAQERGLDVELYYCSADTRSLDGVKIPALGVAIADGTSPHTLDPRFPGACETILNLGENFDVRKLKENRQEIVELTKRCSEHYAAARRFLQALGEVERARLENAAKAFESEKAKKAAARLLAKLKTEKGGVSERYVSAVGVRGVVHLDTEEQNAQRTIYITGKYGFPTLFMDKLFECVSEAGICAVRFPNVVLPDKTEGLNIGGTVFMVCGDEETEEESINSMRFVNGEALSLVRGKIRFAAKCAGALSEGALGALSHMGRAHDELERYYVGAMDFQKSRTLLEKVKEEIFAPMENKKYE
ncbi:MAG: hypothetical protein E7608_02595 [Ruminococcaceae bacterium]|nr:hypothetical protein [Oscillospiraceae bacterium]